MKTKHLLGFILIICIPFTLSAQKSNIQIAIDGKVQYSLADAKRIPFGKSVSLTGDIINNLLPKITLTNVKTGEEIELKVIKTDGNKKWNAFLPQLEPKTPIRLVIHNYEGLTEDEKENVESVFRDMLFAAGIEASNLDTLNALEFNQRITKSLQKQFEPDTIFNGYTIPTATKSYESLGKNFVDLIASINKGKLNFYKDRTAIISDLVEFLNLKKDIDVKLPGEQLTLINNFKNNLQENNLYTENIAEIEIWLKSAYSGKNKFLPIDSQTKQALLTYNKLVGYEQTAKDIETLSTSLADTFPELFDSIKKIKEESFTTETYILPFDIGDLERYGTVDFVQGYIPPLKQTKGFLVFSFYPEGPASRTPEEIDKLSSWTISVGYGVTGNEEDNEDAYMVGISHRMNRLLSITGGLVTSNQRKGKWFGFIGITGDLSNLPFLNNIFTTD